MAPLQVLEPTRYWPLSPVFHAALTLGCVGPQKLHAPSSPTTNVIRPATIMLLQCTLSAGRLKEFYTSSRSTSRIGVSSEISDCGKRSTRTHFPPQTTECRVYHSNRCIRRASSPPATVFKGQRAEGRGFPLDAMTMPRTPLMS